jgi:hypothetical protein
MAVKDASGDVSVRDPDLDKATAPATKSREEQADQGRTAPAPDPQPDVKTDDTAQVQTVAKQAWADMPTGERQYIKGIVKACQDHRINPATLIPVHLAKAASSELKKERGA